MSHCDRSESQGCDAIKIWLARVLIPLKPATSVPQHCNTVKTRLVRALLPLQPAPGQKSSAKQNVVSRAHGFFKHVGEGISH